MRIELSTETGQDKRSIREAVIFSLVTNILEIVAALVMVILVMRVLGGGIEENFARMTAMICLGVVACGAFMDIGKELQNVSTLQREQALEKAYTQLEDLNREMRTQRHDFLNHIQVIYSLIEMEEPEEALKYMDRVYGDLQRVSKMLQTDSPAVNALIQAKVAEAKRRGIELKLSISARWSSPMLPSWEICRVLGNLLDNAMDAVSSARASGLIRPVVELVIGEDQARWFFAVHNNGPAIPEKVQAHMFEPGYTTKRRSDGHGMGLYIVNQIISGMGGTLSVESGEEDTAFSAFIPKARLQLPEGRESESRADPA